jgi:glycerol-3-phosphate dehydrogenase
VQFPERMVVALLNDARRAAAETGVELAVQTHGQARLQGSSAEIIDAAGNVKQALEPTAILNATGAWVDGTLGQLGIASNRLIGGTKGSHFLTNHAALRQRLAGRGVYAEAADGRPVFILPLGQQALIGTTDVPFDGDPRQSRATQAELDYLLAAVNHVFGDLGLTPDDIDWHYAGVRPLPYVDRSVPASITRRHWLHEHADAPLPMFSVIGGKLTTCRSLAEEATARLLARLDLPVVANSQDRPLADREPLPDFDGPTLPEEYLRRVIEQEWVETLDDLVERRLMLLYHPRLTRQCLSQLAELLVAAGRLPAAAAAPAVERLIDRLQDHYGKRVGS